MTKYDAEIFKFEYNRFVIGGFEADRDIQIPAIAIYVPREQVLVQTDPQTMIVVGPAQDRSVAYIGTEADEMYHKIKQKLPKLKPTSVEVNQEFMDWARALHTVQHPSDSLEKLLRI